MTEEQEKIPFDSVLEQLLNADIMLPANLIFRLSDLIPEEFKELGKVWLRM